MKFKKIVRRFRFRLKYRIYSKYSKFQFNLRSLCYIFFDPELDTFSYNLSNSNEILSKLSKFFDIDVSHLQRYRKEFFNHSDLNRITFLSNLFDPGYKLVPKFGRYFSLFIIIRILKPDLIIELGVKDGLGSIVYLKSLALNRQEGNFGELFGVDLQLDKPRYLRKSSNLNYLSMDSISGLEYLYYLGKRSKRLLVLSDTTPDLNIVTSEFLKSLPLATGTLHFVQNSDWNTASKSYSKKLGAKLLDLQDDSNHPFYTGRKLSILNISSDILERVKGKIN